MSYNKNNNSDLVLELSPIFVKSCAGHNSSIFRDNFMILHQVVEDIELACHVHKRQV